MEKVITMSDKYLNIVKAKDAWEADYNSRREIYEDARRAYHKVLLNISKELENSVKNLVGDTSLSLEIQADPYGGKFDSCSYGIKVSANERNKFDENIALSWSWSVWLDSDGNVCKESSSWSGLKATTSTQLEDLEETLRVLKRLNDIDWTTELGRANENYPDWDTYVTVKSPSRKDRPNFEVQLKEALISDVIGANKLIKAAGNEISGSSWYRIFKETPKQYEVVEFSDFSIEYHKNELTDFVSRCKYTTRITKDKFFNKVSENPEIMTF